MDEEPNLSFDIDALFDHLINNLGHDMADEKEWAFFLRSANLNDLEKTADDLEDEFFVQIEESVEEIDSDGNSTAGDPLLGIAQQAVMTVDEVKTLADRIRSIADERGFVYEGVSCYDPLDDEELFGWLDPDDVAWQLQELTADGLEEDAELPWAFLVMTPDSDGMKSIAHELEANGFQDRDDYDEPDEEGSFGICLFVAGTNSETALKEATTKIATIAEQHGGRLEGVQFFTRDDMNEVFGDDDEED